MSVTTGCDNYDWKLIIFSNLKASMCGNKKVYNDIFNGTENTQLVEWL